MAEFLHTMVRITDPARSRSFYEALGFTFERDMDIVRNGETRSDELLLLDGRDHGRCSSSTHNADAGTAPT